MNHTYSISEAQARFPAVVKEAADAPIAITRRDHVVGYLISTERMEAILETLEILANPEAMRAIESAESGRTKYRSLAELEVADKANAG
jgi:PHD/YefM family antitoxin component YafN of YafNO toxin-antitoxin module